MTAAYHIPRFFLITLLSLLTLLPALSQSTPIAIPETAPSIHDRSTTHVHCGTVYAHNHFNGKGQRLGLGCNHLIKDLYERVSSLVIFGGYTCWFYDSDDCGPEDSHFLMSIQTQIAELPDMLDDRMKSVKCEKF